MKGTNLTVKDVLLLAATVLSVIVGVAWLWSSHSVQRVFLVSELGVPLEVTIDGKVTMLGKRSQTEVSLLTGVHRIKVTAKGQPVEEGAFEVPSTDGVVACNILGASPLYNEPIHYGSGAGGSSSFEFYGGQRFVMAPRADFVFTTPPPSISVDQSAGSSHVRWHFARADGGWPTTVGILRDRGLWDAALQVSLRVAEADPTSGDAVLAAASLLERVRGVYPAVAYVEKALAQRPEAYELHSAHLHFLRRADRFEAARVYYREFRRTHAGTLPLVLLARAESRESALALYSEVRTQEPDNELARRGLAYILLTLGRYAESADLFAQVAASDPEYKHYADDHVRSLLAQGLVAEALEAARKAAESAPAEWRVALLHAQVSLLSARLASRGVATGGSAPGSPVTTYIDRFAQKVQDPGLGIWMRSIVGLPVDEALVKKEQLQGEPRVLAARIQIAAAQDPARAWALCASATPATLERLFSPVALLLGAEFLRAGDPVTADRLLAALQDQPLPASAIGAYVMDGDEHPELWRLDDDARAALDFVRARKLETEGGSGELLNAAARRREAWAGIVTQAQGSWPPPRPGKATVTLVRRAESPDGLAQRASSRSR